jgi:hypothetical protein
LSAGSLLLPITFLAKPGIGLGADQAELKLQEGDQDGRTQLSQVGSIWETELSLKALTMTTFTSIVFIKNILFNQNWILYKKSY